MAQRIQWQYKDKDNLPKDEDVSIEKEGALAIGASDTQKVNPNAIHSSSSPQTNGYLNEKLHGQELNYNISRSDTALLELEKRGIMHWSDLTNYDVPAIVWGSDGMLYQALQASGPASAPKDPVSEPAYWQPNLSFSGPAGLQSVQFEHRENKGTPGGIMSGPTIRPITHVIHNDFGPAFEIKVRGESDPNTFIPAIGTYEIESKAIMAEVDRFIGWLENITTPGKPIFSMSGFSTAAPSYWITLYATIEGRVYFNGIDRFKIMAEATNPEDANAMGFPANTTNTPYEKYMITKMTRISLEDIT